MLAISMFCLKKLTQLCHYAHTLMLSRMSSTIGTPKYTEKELLTTLKSKFSKAKDIQVTDISGGCGAMYEIIVESSEFQRFSRLKQHQMIADTLKEQIKDMHGIRIHTIVSNE